MRSIGASCITYRRGKSLSSGRVTVPGFKAALRETFEEIGISSHQIEIWGCLKPVFTRRMNSAVTPVVGVLRSAEDVSFKVQSDEVQTVFSAPIDELCSSHRYTNFRKGLFTSYSRQLQRIVCSPIDSVS